MSTRQKHIIIRKRAHLVKSGSPATRTVGEGVVKELPHLTKLIWRGNRNISSSPNRPHLPERDSSPSPVAGRVWVYWNTSALATTSNASEWREGVVVSRLRDVSTFPDKMAAACCTSPPSAVGSGSGCRRVCRDVRTGCCVRVCVLCVYVWGCVGCVWGGHVIS